MGNLPEKFEICVMCETCGAVPVDINNPCICPNCHHVLEDTDLSCNLNGDCLNFGVTCEYCIEAKDFIYYHEQCPKYYECQNNCYDNYYCGNCMDNEYEKFIPKN